MARRSSWPKIVLGVALAALTLTVATPAQASTSRTPRDSRPRTVVTTDMEQDDLASLIRYLLYTNDLDTEGIIYASGRFHWAGDGKGTEFFLPGREYTTPQTSWRWTGTRTIQDQVLRAYAKVYPNLRAHDPAYPSPGDLLSKVKVGNIDFENEMSQDSDGSDLIRKLLLDNDPRPLYLQAWGGTSTIARALKSIEDSYRGTPRWASVQRAVSAKAVILASGFQDDTYAGYIAPNWPAIKVQDLSAGYGTWGYNCNRGAGNTRGLPQDQKYFQGDWIKQNIQVGPYGSLYRSWLDGQAMPGDPLDVFGQPDQAPAGWCKPLQPYDFLSEGDDVAFLGLLRTGIQNPADPTVGGWGGRSEPVTKSPNLWRLVATEKDASGAAVNQLTSLRWAGAAQNDFAARMQWTLTPRYRDGNHAPSVRALDSSMRVKAGQSVKLRVETRDPDGDRVAVKFWQYPEEGSYPGSVTFTGPGTVQVPADARPGQTVSVIVEATDSGRIPLTRYDRITLHIT